MEPVPLADSQQRAVATELFVTEGADDPECEAARAYRRVGPDNLVYPVDPVALKHGAGVEEEPASPAGAYGRFPKPEPIPFREEFLPGS